MRRRADGKLIHVSVTASPIHGQGGAVIGIALIERDMTQYKALEIQLRQMQKMEAVGRLAGGVAHDFNNLLTIINGYCEVLAEGMVLPESCQQPRPRDCQRRFAGGGPDPAASGVQPPGNRQPDRVGSECSHSQSGADVAPSGLAEDVVLHSTLLPTLNHIKADPGQIDQVIVNLIANARDAMPTGGHLTIETANIDVDELFALTKPELELGPHVMIAVSDTGSGIGPETLPRIFEPFFTNKEKGKGTGMGLATVHGIVKQAGGHISVYSEVGCGTTFKLYFPSAGGDAELRTPATPRATALSGTETILVVEDNSSVRSLTCVNLSRRGVQGIASRQRDGGNPNLFRSSGQN